MCSIGEEEHDIDGGVPRSYDYDLDNHRLVCEIRKRGADGGVLKVVLSGEHAYTVHRVAGEESVVRLTYEDGNLSSTMSSSSGRTSSSSSQVSSSFSSQTLSSNSNTFSTSDAARGREKYESLADRIVDHTFQNVSKTLSNGSIRRVPGVHKVSFWDNSGAIQPRLMADLLTG